MARRDNMKSEEDVEVQARVDGREAGQELDGSTAISDEIAGGSAEFSASPNVVFVGRRLNPKFVDDVSTPDQDRTLERDVPTHLYLPSKTIEIPVGVKYGEPFFSEDARDLINNSPDFKQFIAKESE